MCVKYFIAILVLVAVGLLPAPVYAGGVVTVCDEAHLLAALAGGGTVTFACSGTITLTAEIVIAAVTMIDGSGQAVTISGNQAVRVLTVNTGIMLNLIGINVAHGSAPVGGGIVNNGMLTVDHSTISGNNGGHDYGAGGIQNNATLIVNNSIFSGNTASSGGGIQNNGTLTVSNSIFSGNTAGSGGGIQNNGTLTVSNSTFSSNSASNEGGAIFNADRGTSTVSNSTFSGNRAAYNGGAISNTRSYLYFGRVTVTNSTFSGNSSDHGGGIQSNGTLTVSNSTFSSNTANLGGGISAVTVTVSNSTFFGNSASLTGGGIEAGNWTSVINSTFSGNRAANGGGIHREATLTVSSSTFPGNSATWDGGPYGYNSNPVWLKNTIVANSPDGGNCSGAFTDTGENLSYPDATCPGINADPLLGPLQDNGGPTWTMALGSGSAAIDAADDAICAVDPVNNRDQRGVVRPQGVHCDIGAFERPVKWLPLVLVQ